MYNYIYNYNSQPPYSYLICRLLLILPSRLLEDSSMRRAAMLLWDEDQYGTVLVHSVIYNSVVSVFDNKELLYIRWCILLHMDKRVYNQPM